MKRVTDAATSPRLLVSCTGAAHTYRAGETAVVAAHNVTCTVDSQSRVAITGPSGSGKSTLLYLLAGLLNVTAGSVTWLAPAGSQIGFVFQGPSLMPGLDVVENVSFPLLVAGVSDRDARTRSLAALERLGVIDLSRALPQQLSGGQAQRVAVARALASRPVLIVADEPTGQLDHATGQRVLDVLLAAADQLDAGLLVATHDPAIAGRLSTQWSMQDGQLITADPVHLSPAARS